MVEHMVLLQFDASTAESELDRIAAQLMGLKTQIPGIIDIVAGRNFSQRNKGYGLGLTVRFQDRQSLAGYGPHPAHQAVYRAMEAAGLCDVIAVDFDIA